MTSVADFGAKTEARDVIAAFPDSVRDKIILITGVGPNGLGGTLAQALAAENPRLLILAGRTAAKVESVAEAIATGDSGVETRILLMDLSSFDSVRKAVRAVLAYQEQRIDIVVNNAGIMNVPERRLSSDGFELHLATNYLGTFLFTIGILDKLLGSGSGRIVNVGSNGYIFSPFRFADYNFDGKLLPDNEIPPRELCEQYGLPWSMDYTPTVAYGQSRTALVLFTVQLNRLFNERGISAVCVHPGAIDTNLWRYMPRAIAEQMFTLMPMKTVTQGISTVLVAALDPKLSGSEDLYLVDCQLSPVSDYAKNIIYAEKLWTLSKSLVEVDV